MTGNSALVTARVTTDGTSSGFTVAIYRKKGSASTFLVGEHLTDISVSGVGTFNYPYTDTILDNSDPGIAGQTGGEFYYSARIECLSSATNYTNSAAVPVVIPWFLQAADGSDLAVAWSSGLTVTVTAQVRRNTTSKASYLKIYKKSGSAPTYQPGELINTQTIDISGSGIASMAYTDTISAAGDWYYLARIENVATSYSGASVTDAAPPYHVTTPVFTGAKLTLAQAASFGAVINVTLIGTNAIPIPTVAGQTLKLYRKKDSAPTFLAGELVQTVALETLAGTFSTVLLDSVTSSGTWYYAARFEITSGSYSGGDFTSSSSINLPVIWTTSISDPATSTPHLTTVPPLPPTAIPHDGIDELIVLVKATGTPATGFVYTDQRVVSSTYQRMEWRYHRRGGCGWFRLMLRENFPEANQAIDEGWEIHVRIRLPADVTAAFNAGLPEPAYVTWYRGVIRSATYNQTGNERLVDVQGWGYVEQVQKIQVQKKYPSGLQVRDIVLDIVNKYITPYTRVVRGDALDPTNFNIDPATYKTVGEIFFECSAYKALKTLAELQGGIEFGVDADRRFYWKQTSSTIQKNFYGDKDSIVSRSGGRTDERTNQIKVEGTHFGSRELLKIRGDVTDITANGLYEVPTEMPWIGNDQDASRWADNLIAEWKLRRDWRLVTWQGVDKRLEQSHPLQKVQYTEGADITNVFSPYLINRIHYTKGGFAKKGEVIEVGSTSQQRGQDQAVIRAEIFLGAYPGDLIDELETMNDQIECLKGKGKQFRLPPDVTTVTGRIGNIPGELLHFERDITNDVLNVSTELQDITNPRGILISWLSKQWTKISLRRTFTALPTRGLFIGEIISLLTDVTYQSFGDGYFWTGNAWRFINGTTAGEANTASNVGTAGVGVFKAKSALDLQFKKIAPMSDSINVVDNTGASQVDIDLLQPFDGWQFFEEFMDSNAVPAGWSLSVVSLGTGALSSAGRFNDTHPGQYHLSTGASATGQACLYKGYAFGFVCGNGKITFDTMVNIPTLATGAQDFDVYVGIGNPLTEPDYGYYFKYDRGTSANWLRVTSTGGVKTSVNTGVAVDVSWFHFTIVVNSDNTSVEFFINGVSVGSSTTNLTTAYINPTFQIVKQVGVTAVDLYVDYCMIRQKFPFSRYY